MQIDSVLEGDNTKLNINMSETDVGAQKITDELNGEAERLHASISFATERLAQKKESMLKLDEDLKIVQEALHSTTTQLRREKTALYSITAGKCV